MYLRILITAAAVATSPLAADLSEAQDTIRVRADGPPAWGTNVRLVRELAVGRLDGPPEYALGRIFMRPLSPEARSTSSMRTTRRSAGTTRRETSPGGLAGRAVGPASTRPSAAWRVDVHLDAEKRLNLPEKRPDGGKQILRWRERTTYDVFSPAGQYLGRVTLPEETVLLAIQGNRLYTRGRGPDDEERLVIYRLDVNERR